ncbi:hypothetical protein [Lactococcus garvieae]
MDNKDKIKKDFAVTKDNFLSQLDENDWFSMFDILSSMILLATGLVL